MRHVGYLLSYVYSRDASWHPRSKAGGRTLVFHACNPNDLCLAACSRTIMLNDESERELSNVPVQLRCSKPACRKAFKAMEAP